jgi:predicted AlkP superfamily phosphohydrolase/phosphomutase
MPRRVIALWLDGFDMALADSYGLPALAELRRRGVVATLDHGTAHLTGLTGEHLSAGLDPDAAARASAVHFDPRTYRCVQEGTRHAPVFGGVRTVMFDLAYFDFDRASEDVVGISDWGVHDPGGRPLATPASLSDEVEDRFGAYPARRWIYGVPWSSSADCTKMGRDLSQAVESRSRIAHWLLGERFTDWKLALIGFSEAHSASEGLFHGSGATHPWANLKSAPEAARALRSVYAAIDTAVGELVQAFPDDTVVVFSMHGMGPNSSDVPSMALLGELLARWSGAETDDARPFSCDDNGIPVLPPHTGWTTAVLESLTGRRAGRVQRLVRAVKYRVPSWARQPLARLRRSASRGSRANEGSLMWMPLMRHQARWPDMRAFALPSFYDGRIRVNLAGREASGQVTIDEYDALLDEIEHLLRSCTESRTGRLVVSEIHRTPGDPLARADDDVDMIVLWADDVLGFAHSDLGTFGPLPPRRTGGHTSPTGRCMIVGPDVSPGHLGVRSSFDVVPTLLSLAGGQPLARVSGRAFA